MHAQLTMCYGSANHCGTDEKDGSAQYTTFFSPFLHGFNIFILLLCSIGPHLHMQYEAEKHLKAFEQISSTLAFSKFSIFWQISDRFIFWKISDRFIFRKIKKKIHIHV